MDFAFVPPPLSKKDHGIPAARDFFSGRLPAAAIVPKATGSLERILEWIDAKVPTGQQVGSVFFVSHASDHHVSIPMRPGSGKDTHYSHLVELKKNGTFKAPLRFTTPVPAGGTPIALNIKGCRVGSSEIFLRLLKDLMGGHVEVTAPQHYNGFMSFSDRTSFVVFETLTYNIEVHRKDPITTHAKLVDAFKQAAFERYDGSQIPDSEIDAILKQLVDPVAIKPVQYLATAKSKKQIRHPLTVKLGFPEAVIGRATHADRSLAQLRTECVRRTIAGMNLADFGAKPLMDHVAEAAAKWEQDFGEPLAGAGSKSFGEHLGLAASEDFETIVDWKAVDHVDEVSKAKGKKIIGTYFRYQLLLPITSVSDGKLLFESEPVRGTPLTTPVTWPTDATHRAALFRTV